MKFYIFRDYNNLHTCISRVLKTYGAYYVTHRIRLRIPSNPSNMRNRIRRKGIHYSWSPSFAGSITYIDTTASPYKCIIFDIALSDKR